MDGRRGDDWQSAMRVALRWFGLSDKPNVGPLRLAAVLIVVGAALMAATRHSVAFYIGAVLFLIGAVIAARGWARLMRFRQTKSN
jgi:hypothetical protein